MSPNCIRSWLLPRRSVNAAREDPVREPPQVGAGTHRESIVDPRRVITPAFRNARRKATVFHIVVRRMELEQTLKPVNVILST